MDRSPVPTHLNSKTQLTLKVTLKNTISPPTRPPPTTSHTNLATSKMVNTPIESTFQSPSSPQQTSPSSHFSIHFHPLPRQEIPPQTPPQTQPCKHFTKQGLAPTPLTHQDIVFPITLNVNLPHLPELPLCNLPQLEDELCTEQLKSTLERLKDANSRVSPEAAAQYAVNGNDSAGNTGDNVTDGMVNGSELNGLIGVKSMENEDTADQGGAAVKIEPEVVSTDSNQEKDCVGGEDALGLEGSEHQEHCNGDPVERQGLKEGCSKICESVKEEPVLAEGVEVEREVMGLKQENELDIADVDRATAHGVAGSNEPQEGLQTTTVESDGLPRDGRDAQDQPQRRNKKRCRDDVGTGYWLRSRKPPSSSKRARRTAYWLRP